MGTRGEEGNSSKLPIKKVLILDKNLLCKAGQQLPHRSSHAASALSILPELQQKREFLLQQASWRSTHISKGKLWSNIKGENIETQRKIKIFLSLYVQLGEAQYPSPICPTPVQESSQSLKIRWFLI